MASLQDIRRRIRSVKNTQQVTKAMSLPGAALIQSPTVNQAKPDLESPKPAMAWS